MVHEHFGDFWTYGTVTDLNKCMQWTDKLLIIVTGCNYVVDKTKHVSSVFRIPTFSLGPIKFSHLIVK